MEFGEHPLRRRYAPELVLGLGIALLTAWLLVGEVPALRGRGEERGDPAKRPAVSAPSQLARPESSSPEMSAARAQSHSEVEKPTRAAAASHTHPAAAEEERPRTLPTEALLDVLVLDAAGAAARGVPVDLDLETKPFSSGPGNPLRPTDANGRTTIPLAWFEPPDFGFGVRYWHVLRASVPLRAAPSIDFGPTVPPPGLVTLALPPAGRLLVHVSGIDGAPIDRGASVYAVVHSAGGEPFSTPAEVRDGLAEFPWIDLDAEIELGASFDDQRAPKAHATVAGPKSIGETIECTLVLGPDWPVIRFRVVDEHRQPMAVANVHVRVAQEPLSPQEGSCVADEEGRAELRICGPTHADHARTVEFQVELPVRRGAEILLPSELESSMPTDLGDVVLCRR